METDATRNGHLKEQRERRTRSKAAHPFEAIAGQTMNPSDMRVAVLLLLLALPLLAFADVNSDRATLLRGVTASP